MSRSLDSQRSTKVKKKRTPRAQTHPRKKEIGYLLILRGTQLQSRLTSTVVFRHLAMWQKKKKKKRVLMQINSLPSSSSRRKKEQKQQQQHRVWFMDAGGSLTFYALQVLLVLALGRDDEWRKCFLFSLYDATAVR